MQPNPKFDGTKLVLGGREFILPPLNMRLVKKFNDDLEKLFKIGTRLATTEELEKMTDIILASLQRNYPDLQAEELDDLLDIDTLPSAFMALVKVNRMTKEAKTEGATDQPSPEIPAPAAP